MSSLYQAQNRNSTANTFNFSWQEMNNLCSYLDVLEFTERIERQYHSLQSLILNDTRSDLWIQENIQADDVLSEVYHIIKQQPL